MENIYSTDWDLSQEQPGYVWDRIRLGRRTGARMLGASVYLIKPGQKSFPYHYHHGNEEMLIVLDGSVTVRTPDGDHVAGRGDALSFATGPAGAHQLINHTDRDARVLMMSTMVSPEIVEYPDSGKVGVFAERAPGDPSSGIRAILDGGAVVDYFDGE
ncbi:MAG: cupin domain-containing protein [Acidimicrobiia bacterium]|jgi:uncharacterized cupin superfamily protein